MDNNTVITGVLIGETGSFSFGEVCHQYNIPQELLIEMIEYGLFGNQSADWKQLTLDSKTLARIQSATRLHKELEINLQGVALVLELMEEIEHMRNELEILRKHF